MLSTILQVALGGAMGASGRYLVGVGMMRSFGPQPFPLGVITVNILGSFLMGALVVFLGDKQLTHWNAFLATGFLGGFTTFSSFSLEAYRLIEKGDVTLAVSYIGLSVGAGLLGLVAGILLMRAML
ncbi:MULTISPECIES: fluoride efflux transporter CrcB [Thioclava]|uniref:Fluoride-specific ion channel FluC n=1 Tax=Thioclava nitratireducens TaxID=1915078 RepID=A0ABN4X9Z6_9RHOB|nr:MULTISPECIES: fluoride efflux transporter CrcB [Thioclava]AQS47036.1 protein CrcB [Thioclava nitratireducens]OWY00989.1 protein CrcB [Thioclava sp. IC9]OWY01105.1 protein CrcB [Thioclava sp. F1Mire-8]OWY08674.1 protein CrcB [Thioclava sp. F42-5]OWY11835.1 protein CrcB [Thioclava sp. F34-6]